MDDCIFCKIVAGEIPAQVIAENADALAFDDINPVAPVHFLVIPRDHIPSTDGIADEQGDIVASCMRLVRDTARGLMPDGYRVVTNTGPMGGQVVPHLHFHVLGGRAMTWPPG